MCYSPQNHTETNKRKAALQIELINRRLSLGTHFTAATYLLGRIMLLQLVIIKTTVCFVFFFFSIYYLLLFVFIRQTYWKELNTIIYPLSGGEGTIGHKLRFIK